MPESIPQLGMVIVYGVNGIVLNWVETVASKLIGS